MTRDSSASGSFLICRSNSRLCALPLEHVEETMRALPIESIPEMPSFLLGASMIRGAVTPVVNVAKLVCGMTDASHSRFVTLKLGERRVAFAMEDVIGIRQLDIASIEEIPLLVRELDASIIAAIATLDSELLLVLQSARLLPESVWKSIGEQVRT